MRYVLVLVIAIALTIVWQTSVVADMPTSAGACTDGVLVFTARECR